MASTRRYLEERRGLPGDAEERILHRRVRDLLLGLPPVPLEVDGVSTARSYRQILTEITDQQVDLVGWMIMRNESLRDLFLQDDLRVVALVDSLTARQLLAADWWRGQVLNMAGQYTNAVIDILFDELPEHARRIFTELAFRVAER